MSQFERTKFAIDKDIEQVFAMIKSEARSNYFISKDNDLTRTQNLIRQYVPRMVMDRSSLLLDTALNYLTEDARKVLTGAESQVINDFYDENRRWKKILTDEFNYSVREGKVKLSSDPRIVYSTGAGSAVFVFSLLVKTALGLESPVLLPLALMSSAGVFALTYKQTTVLVINQLEEDVAQYLQQSRSKTMQELLRIVKMYEDQFATFQQGYKRV
jgi:vacuolar-type H+-ATPase subunit E/Vma4